MCYRYSHLCNSKNWGLRTSQAASHFLLPPSLSLCSSGKTSFPLLCPSSSLTWAANYPNSMGKCLFFLPVLSWSIIWLVLLCLSQKAIFQWQKEEERDRDGLSQDGIDRDLLLLWMLLGRRRRNSTCCLGQWNSGHELQAAPYLLGTPSWDFFLPSKLELVKHLKMGFQQ